MSDVGLTHIALPVTDLERSVGFYGRYAGMQVVHRRKDVVWLSDHTRPFVIVLIETREVFDPLRPIAHLGVGCASRDELDEQCKKADREGVLITGPNDYGPPVGYWALFRDPDGHTLEVSHGQEVALAVQISKTGSDQGSTVSPKASHSA
ncbi:MAG: VOC family protein [Myxococcota bacterium]|nr:bleomycin resistance protein [Deltaproteobacteria bacterium]MCP4240906.1 VOC family protein [bacterium]MDP6075535.1 VOC family protein [Myxococcota bacterium]MDP6242408.1 VOC family protein [Myxococcota bacterium]MDP7075983.1 VOC family protein [Myxococcota bacterium]